MLDLLSQLMDKSLVLAQEERGRRNSLRYRMLVPVRQFGREKLEESTEAQDVLRRHTEYYLDLAERADPSCWGRIRHAGCSGSGPSSGTCEERSRGRSSPTGKSAQSSGYGSWPRWGVSGAERVSRKANGGYRWRWRVTLEGSPSPGPKRLQSSASFCSSSRSYGPAIAAFEEAVAIYKELGDETGAAFALANLGQAAVHGGLSRARASFEREGGELLEGDLPGPPRAYLLVILGMAAHEEGDLDLAASRLGEGLALCREFGLLREGVHGPIYLGNVEIDRGELDQGSSAAPRGRQDNARPGDIVGTAYYVWGLGRVAVLRQDPVRAARLWGAGEALREQMGMSLSHLRPRRIRLRAGSGLRSLHVGQRLFRCCLGRRTGHVPRAGHRLRDRRGVAARRGDTGGEVHA